MYICECGRSLKHLTLWNEGSTLMLTRLDYLQESEKKGGRLSKRWLVLVITTPNCIQYKAALVLILDSSQVLFLCWDQIYVCIFIGRNGKSVHNSHYESMNTIVTVACWRTSEVDSRISNTCLNNNYSLLNTLNSMQCKQLWTSMTTTHFEIIFIKIKTNKSYTIWGSEQLIDPLNDMS